MEFTKIPTPKSLEEKKKKTSILKFFTRFKGKS
jgi:hypothetical protein